MRRGRGAFSGRRPRGGTRRWASPTEGDAVHDVVRLSEGMTYKAAAADLAMGGAKSVIILPKAGHQPTEAEGRAMGRFVRVHRTG